MILFRIKLRKIFSNVLLNSSTCPLTFLHENKFDQSKPSIERLIKSVLDLL